MRMNGLFGKNSGWTGLLLVACLVAGIPVEASRQMEYLDRGVVAVYKGSGQVYVGWRMYATEPTGVSYNVYRGSVKINSVPITDSTNFIDPKGNPGSTYRVAAVIDGVEQEPSDSVAVWESFCRSISLAPIEGAYSPNDASVGDLDGDGRYEIVLKRLSQDRTKTSTTFNVIEAYELDGTFMWRINLGPNDLLTHTEINPIVYDFDGDGRAELALRTCEGMTDASGAQIGDMDGDGKTDYRDSAATPGDSWYMTEGPEFLSIFDGRTGAEIARTDYIERDPIESWGWAGLSLGSYAHRADKCMMTPAYLDGERPSLVICRGIYARTVLEAWNFRDGVLSKVWTFDSDENPGYAGQGNHNLTVGDVDADGRDEIVYASMCVDDDGSGLYTTGLGHGDALHMSDMIPDRPGLEIYQCQENAPYGTTLRDARTGEIIWRKTAEGDTGRCSAGHIDARYPGYQVWSVGSGGTYDASTTNRISSNTPNWGNFMVWWDGDLQREILDDISGHNQPYIDKWGGNSAFRLLSLYNIPSQYDTRSINCSKGNPCLSGDILGDWREEMIYRSADNTQLRIFTTTTLTTNRIYTLMNDSQYRTAVSWQCNMYNQPPHPSFYIGAQMDPPPVPDIEYVIPQEESRPVPTGVQASALSFDKVLVSWAASPEAVSYTIKRAAFPGGPYATLATGVHDADYLDASAMGDTSYYYVVSATYATGQSVDSPEAITKTPVAPGTIGVAASVWGQGGYLESDGVTGVLLTTSSFDMQDGNAVVFIATYENYGTALPTVTFAGEPMSVAVSTSQGIQQSAIYYLVDPETNAGPFQIIMAVPGDACDIGYSQLSLSHVAGLAATTGNTSSSSATTMPLDVNYATVSNGCFVVGAAINNNASLPPSIAYGNSDMVLLRDGLGSSGHLHTYGNIPSAGSYTDGYYGQYDRTAVASAVFNAIPLPAEPPAAPANLAAEVVSASRIDLSWSESEGASGYDIKRSGVRGGPYTPIAYHVSDTHYTDTGLADGATYFYVVSSVNAAGASADSSEAVASIPLYLPLPIEVVHAVSGSGGYLTSDEISGLLLSTESFSLDGGNAVVFTATYENLDYSAGLPAVSFAGQPMNVAVSINETYQTAAIYYLLDPAIREGSFEVTMATPGAASDIGCSYLSLSNVSGVAVTAMNTSTSNDSGTPLEVGYECTSGNGFVVGAVVNNNASASPSWAYGHADTVLLSSGLGSSGHLHVYGDVLNAGFHTDGYYGQYQRTAIVSAVFDAVSCPVTPPEIRASVSNGVVALDWPESYAGWQLQFRTNLLEGDWIIMPASTTNNVHEIVLDELSEGQMYFKLVYPRGPDSIAYARRSTNEGTSP